MGAEEEGIDPYYAHPTKILMTGTDAKGVAFKPRLVDFDKFDDVIERSNQEFAPGAPKTGPKLPETVVPFNGRGKWKRAA